MRCASFSPHRTRPEPEAQWLLEPVCFHQAGVAKHQPARPISNDAPPIQQNGAEAKLQRHLEVVGGDELGAFQAADELDEPAPAPWVEVGRRLIQHQYGRTAREHTSQTGPFALAETQMMRLAVSLGGKIDARQAFQGDLARLGCAEVLD